MAGRRKLYIFIAAVSTFAFLHIHGQEVTCKNPIFEQAGGACYKINEDKEEWPNARDICRSLNGKLATFSSVDQMTEILTELDISLGRTYWVGTPGEAQETNNGQWFAFWEPFFIGLQLIANNTCKTTIPVTFKSICMENDNNLPVNNSTLSGTPPKQKETCSNFDSILIDGQCYHLSPVNLAAQDAYNYCESLNRKLATISSVELGIRLLRITTKGRSFQAFWATDPLNKGKTYFFDLNQSNDCTKYTYGQILVDSDFYPVLCME